jgi:hypothetical protein
MRRRRARRRLGVAAAFVYLGLVVWLLSPLWQGVADETASRTPMRPVPAGRPLGAISLGQVDPVPSRLPGYTPPEEASEAVGGEVEASEGSEFEPVESGTESTSTSTGEESSSQAPPSSSGGHEEQSVIGFEG